MVQSSGYIREAARLCKANRVLFAADEVQTGLCRTGRTLACDHDDIKPDLVFLGKVRGVLLKPSGQQQFLPCPNALTF
jgi:ornithine--oxo-acid transaminase